MTGTIVLKEKRSVVDGFRKWYVENLIETGRSQKFEVDFVDFVDKQIASFEHLGELIPILAVILSDKKTKDSLEQVGKVVSSPQGMKLIRMAGENLKRNVIMNKRKFEAGFIKADGSSEKVVIPEMTMDDLKDGLEAAIDVIVSVQPPNNEENIESAKARR